MQKKKLWIILGSVLCVLIVLAIVLPITLLSTRKKPNFIFESQTIVYDGQVHYLEVQSDLPNSIQITYENNGHKNVGSYEVIAHIEGYSDMTATLTILPASLEEIEFKDTIVTYDGKVHSILVSGNIPEDIIVTYENNNQVNVGTYLITAHFSSAENNYQNLIDLTATLTIEKALFDLNSVTFEDGIFTYDGTPKSLEITGELPEGITVEYVNNNQKEAGIYEVSAKFNDVLGNFIIDGTLSAKLTIEKATIDMSMVHFTSIEIPYDGLEHELLIDGDLPEGVSILSYTNNKRTELGESLCKVEFSYDEKNYNPIPAMTATLKIVPGPMNFLQKTEFQTVYNGQVQSLDYGPLPEGISVTYENNSYIHAGSYVVIAYFKDAYGRYLDKTMQLTFIIQKATYDLSNIAFTDAVFVYDGLEHFLFIQGELPQGVKVSYTKNSLTEIGRIEVIASFTIPDSLNYNPIPGRTAYLTIVPKNLEGVYLEDATFSYDGEYHSLVLQGELPLGVTYTFINNEQKEVGSYEVIVRFNVEAYGELRATLTITKADIDMSKVFFHGATFVYDGLEHALFIEGELPPMVRVTYQNNTRTEVGRQTAIAIFEVLDKDHYNDIPCLTAELIIVDNQLTGISFQDKTVVYNQLEHSIFIDGDLPSGVTVSYTNNGQVNVGTYEIIAHFNDSTGQYQNLENMVAYLTILKANFAKNGIIFLDREFVYDGTSHRLDIYCDDIPSDIQVVYENNDQVNAGRYEVVVSFIDPLGNYNPVLPLKAILIIKRAQYDLSHIVFENEEYEYDGFEHTLTIHGKLPSGVSVSYTRNSLTKLGRILVTVTFKVDEKNYEPIPSRSAYLTITKGPLENVSLKGKTVVYDGNVHSLEIEGTLPPGVIVEYQNNDQVNAGVYKVVADFYDAEGYYNSLTAYLTIKKAVYDMSGISFVDASYPYDGNPHTLQISGELPEGVTVLYTTNTLTNAGSILVTARFIGNPNYEDIPSLVATLTIEKLAITGITFEGGSFTYDGLEHSIYVEGLGEYPIRVLYYNNSKIDAGTYEVIATFVLLNDNYLPLDDMRATLHISPIPLGEVTLEDQTFILDGEVHSLSINTVLPAGVYAIYENNEQRFEGVYIVTMHLESNHNNYILPSPITATMTIISDGSYHTVIFHISEDEIEKRIVKDNDGIEDIPEPAKRLGYDGYFEEDFSHITSFMEVYPVYRESLFTMHFDSNMVEDLQVRYKSSYTLPIPTKEDYIFKKWVDEEGNEVTDGDYLWTSDITLYSVWQCKVIIQNVNDYVYEELVLDSNDYVVPQYPYSSYLDGFYLDLDLTIPFDLNQPVLTNQTLYTKYVYDFDFILNENDEAIVTTLLDYTKEFYNLATPIYDLYPVVEIPEEVFAGCSNVTRIHIPALEGDFGMLFGMGTYTNSVPVVQRSGIYYLPVGLTEVQVSDTKIPTFAFWNCEMITKIILENVEEVEGFAFQDCTGLMELEIRNCNHFGEGAFRGCTQLEKVYCDSLESWLKLSFYDSLSTPMASADELYIADELMTSFILKDKEFIGAYQFYGLKQIKEVKIENIGAIGNQAFRGCSGLQTIWLDNTLEQISMDAFAGVVSLEGIYFDGSLEDWSRIVFQNQYATPMLYSPKFYTKIDETYELLQEIHLNEEVLSIGDYQFYGFKNIEKLTLDSVETIGVKAFSNMEILENFVMPSTILQIEEDAFSDTTIVNIEYLGDLEDWGNIAFMSANSTPLWSTEGEINFANFALNLEKIVLSDKESVGNFQFFGFKNTKEVEICTPLAQIGQNAFGYCANLEIFRFDSLENAVLNENAFLGCRNLKNVYYSGNLNTYLKMTYKNREANPLYYQAQLWINNSLVEEITIDEDLEDYKLYGLSSLRKVTFTSSVKKIGRYALANCSALTDVVGLDGITSIGDSAFEATGLTQIRLSNITAIPNSCFRNCSSLVRVEIPLVKTIGASAFSGCSSLTTIDIRQIEQIGNSAFNGCRSLKEIHLEKITKLEHNTFANCYGLETITLPNTLTQIAYATFYGCTKLEKIVIPESVSVIEQNAFSAASNVVVYAMHNGKPSTWKTGWDNGVKEVYWYSETFKEGNYWHFDADFNCIIW